MIPRGGSVPASPRIKPDPRDRELHRLAVLLHVAASNGADEAYYRGYTSGISRRIAGGADPDDPEVVAFELLQDAPGGLVQVLGRGYRDGLEGKGIKSAGL